VEGNKRTSLTRFWYRLNQARGGSSPHSGELEQVFAGIGRGEPPPPDGLVEVMPPPTGPSDVVCAFTAHTVIAAAVQEREVLRKLAPDDLGAPMEAGFLVWLGEQLGAPPGMLDLVLVATGDAPATRVQIVPQRGETVARVERARRYRRDVQVFGDSDSRGIGVVGRGLARRWEVAVEVEPAHRDRGLGRGLFAAARRLVPEGEPLFAQVSPGNAASVRAVLAAGFEPVGSEVLFLTRAGNSVLSASE
jgi:GNAT superfamily N-acetyltransferase